MVRLMKSSTFGLDVNVTPICLKMSSFVHVLTQVPLFEGYSFNFFFSSLNSDLVDNEKTQLQAIQTDHEPTHSMNNTQRSFSFTLSDNFDLVEPIIGNDALLSRNDLLNLASIFKVIS